ncbi:hypothetical protein ACFYW9_24450 [Streptomyces sp. NPDC002698]|uniref:hypothetical protein n=1 Tax=Streptomyces sp. NPDC002698 TaxID=3364660 RepID=UPI0036AA83D0
MGMPGEVPRITPPGVYAPQKDTELLMHALSRERVGPSTDVLDLGTDSALVPFGPVLNSRRTWLRRQGLLTDENDDREELVVIRARQA